MLAVSGATKPCYYIEIVLTLIYVAAGFFFLLLKNLLIHILSWCHRVSVSTPVSPTPFRTAALSLLDFSTLALKVSLGFQDPGSVTLDLLIVASVAAIIRQASRTA